MEQNANFVTLLPKHLPIDCELRTDQSKFRPELLPKSISDHPQGDCWSNWSGFHPCSWSFEIVGKNRSIRCKQFLYDLGPLSSFDHAALYDHKPEVMKYFDVDGDRVAWLGIDYAQKITLSAVAWGTNIEFRVTQGNFTEEELIGIFKSTQPTDHHRHDILTKPFSQLSYWSRYPRYDLHMCSMSYRPPSSFWKIRWPWAPTDHQWKWDDTKQNVVLEIGGKTWNYNSSCLFSNGDQLFEKQLLFFPKNQNRHQQLWFRKFSVLTSPLKKPSLDKTPDMEIFSGKTSFGVENLPHPTVGRYYIAYENKKIGPYDALWWYKDHMYLIHISAGMDQKYENFKLSLESCIKDLNNL